jgi:hypothetical protein
VEDAQQQRAAGDGTTGSAAAMEIGVAVPQDGVAMPAPFRRYSSRSSQFVRMWRVLVLLRSGPKTLQALADDVGASQRTVRRDIECLQAAGLPVWKLGADTDEDEWLPNMSPLWYVGAVREWPRRQATPTEMLRPREARN